MCTERTRLARDGLGIIRARLTGDDSGAVRARQAQVILQKKSRQTKFLKTSKFFPKISSGGSNTFVYIQKIHIPVWILIFRGTTLQLVQNIKLITK